MLQAIAGGAAVLRGLRSAADRGEPIPLEAVRLWAPIPGPPEYLGVGLNYREHLTELNLPEPTEPLIFNKQVSCICGPLDDVLRPRGSDQVDYEGELGLIIGHVAGRNLTHRQASDAIFGYVVANDLSVRDWQLSSPTVTLGKSFDTHGPLGPWIVTADEVPEPHNLMITTTINGQIRQHGSTAEMIFDCPSIVAFLSRTMTLKPGTVVTTGTPGGVGHFQRPPAYLRVGDRVTVEITGLGRLSNRVVAET
jgi:2-keto-4-pentenoate hydratase/2-oxohepta-3-ene-1,7-dioic acid hydratase in catechol pathway